MTNFFTLLKVLLKSKYAFKSGSKKKMIGLFAALGVAYLFILGLVGLYLYIFVPAFENDMNRLTFLLMLSVVIVVIIMGLVSMLTYVYFNRDSEFLATLPVKSSTIFSAKLTIVYLSELLLSVLLLFPILLLAGIFAGMNALFFLAIPLVVLITPMIPLVFIAILAIPLMYVVSFFRNRGAVTTLFLILIFAAFFALYMWAVMGLQSIDYAAMGEQDISGLLKGLDVLAYVFYPLSRLADFACGVSFYGLGVGVSALLNFVIGLMVTVVLVALAIWISGLVYYKGVAAQLENTKKSVKKESSYKSSGSNVATLLKREFKDVTRNSAFGFQCLSGIIMVPLMVTLFYFLPTIQASAVAEGAEAEELVGMLGNMFQYFSLWILMAMGVGMNTAVSTALSREGKSFMIFKTLPVTPRESVTAKLLLGYIVSAATLVISTVLYAILHRMPVLDAVLMIIFLLIYAYAFCCFALWNDIRAPKLDWTAPSEVVKRGPKVYLPMLVNMGMTIPLLVVYALVGMVLPWLAWIILYALSIGLAFLFNHILHSRAEGYYAKIEI